MIWHSTLHNPLRLQLVSEQFFLMFEGSTRTDNLVWPWKWFKDLAKRCHTLTPIEVCCTIPKPSRIHSETVVAGKAHLQAPKAKGSCSFFDLVSPWRICSSPEVSCMLFSSFMISHPNMVEYQMKLMDTLQTVSFQRDRQSNAALQLSQLETERLMAWLAIASVLTVEKTHRCLASSDPAIP